MAFVTISCIIDLPDEKKFVLVGEVEGSIGEGDFVRIPVNREGNRMKFLISKIVAEQGEPQWELHLHALPTLVKILRGLQLVGRTFEVEDFRKE